jgi:hypothetical protein
MSTAWTEDVRRPRDERHFAELVRYCVGIDRTHTVDLTDRRDTAPDQAVDRSSN